MCRRAAEDVPCPQFGKPDSGDFRPLFSRRTSAPAARAHGLQVGAGTCAAAPFLVTCFRRNGCHQCCVVLKTTKSPRVSASQVGGEPVHRPKYVGGPLTGKRRKQRFEGRSGECEQYMPGLLSVLLRRWEPHAPCSANNSACESRRAGCVCSCTDYISVNRGRTVWHSQW